MPQIRPIKFIDKLGRPIENGAVYVFEAGMTYTDSGALLPLTDAFTGTAMDNPFYIDSDGFPVNEIGGARVNPTVARSRWGLYAVNANGVAIYDLPVQQADTFGSSLFTADATFNNFTDAILENMADYDFVFIRSQGSSGWENTLAGPDNSFFAHATGGTVGTPSSGTPELFYDSQGKEFAMSDVSTFNYFLTDTNITTQSSTLQLTGSYQSVPGLENPDTSAGLYEYEFMAVVSFTYLGAGKNFSVRERHSDGSLLEALDSVRQIQSAISLGLSSYTQFSSSQETVSLSDEFTPIGDRTAITSSYYLPISLSGRLRQEEGKAATIELLQESGPIPGNKIEVSIGQARFKKVG